MEKKQKKDPYLEIKNLSQESWKLIFSKNKKNMVKIPQLAQVPTKCLHYIHFNSWIFVNPCSNQGEVNSRIFGIWNVDEKSGKQNPYLQEFAK